MNRKTKSSKTQTPCLCQGAGPLLTELVRRLGPPEQAQRHFKVAKIEFLKGLRALIDARIDQVSKTNARGEKIDVE